MKTLGNVLWFIFGGFLQGISWYFIGFLWSITIIGIPVGKQCFKIGRFIMFPFKKEIIDVSGTTSTVANILWIIFGGLGLALESLIAGVLLCMTIIGIPFGLQHFKFARLALMPFGKKVVDI